MEAIGATNVAVIVKGSAQALNSFAHGASAAAATSFEDALHGKVGSRLNESSERSKARSGAAAKGPSAKSAKHSGEQIAAPADRSVAEAPDADGGPEAVGKVVAAGTHATQSIALLPEDAGAEAQAGATIALAGRPFAAAEGKVQKPGAAQVAAQVAAGTQAAGSVNDPALPSPAGAIQTQGVGAAAVAFASARGGGAENVTVPATISAGMTALAERAHTARAGAAAVSGGAGEKMQAPDEARVFEASTHALEVGFASGTHGWLRVRAELDPGGAVVAQVVAASAGAAAGLHKELPAISAYLAHEQVGVSTLVVNAAERGAGTQDAGAGEAFGFGAGHGSGRGNGGGAAEENASGDGGRASAWEGMPSESFDARVSLGNLGWIGGSHGAATQGGWVNVRV